MTLSLNGETTNNNTVSSFIELDGTFGFETFSFSEFTSLKELRLENGSDFFQFDQIVFNVVPEPGTIALFALGVFIWPREA